MGPEHGSEHDTKTIYPSCCSYGSILCLVGTSTKRPFQIGWLAFGHDAQSEIDRSLKDALVQNGLVERNNIEFVYRFAKGSSTQLSQLANEFADLKPDILVGIGGMLSSSF